MLAGHIPLSATLAQAESLYRHGHASHAEVKAYLKLWNAGPHFTQAVLWGDRIENYDPCLRRYPEKIEAEYGVRRGARVETYGGGRYTSVSWHAYHADALAEARKLRDGGRWQGSPPRVVEDGPEQRVLPY